MAQKKVLKCAAAQSTLGVAMADSLRRLGLRKDFGMPK